jgi:hypothetical protein
MAIGLQNFPPRNRSSLVNFHPDAIFLFLLPPEISEASTKLRYRGGKGSIIISSYPNRGLWAARERERNGQSGYEVVEPNQAIA